MSQIENGTAICPQTLDESIIDVVPPPPPLNTEEDDQPQEEPKKKGRGRPKIFKTEEELWKEQQNITPRGRPKGTFKLEGKLTTEDKNCILKNTTHIHRKIKCAPKVIAIYVVLSLPTTK